MTGSSAFTGQRSEAGTLDQGDASSRIDRANTAPHPFGDGATGPLGPLDRSEHLGWRVQDGHGLRDVRAAHPQPPRETGAVGDGRVGDRLRSVLAW